MFEKNFKVNIHLRDLELGFVHGFFFHSLDLLMDLKIHFL